MEYIDPSPTAAEVELRQMIAVCEAAHRAHMQPLYDALARTVSLRARPILLTPAEAERFGALLDAEVMRG
ncbi:hypothetical protein [Xanthomonas cannabis]|uniref:hypothetical protein n=1 Tax=Xanthomonas cannabis TaxID=1885674 RepID=UPI0033AE29C4